jgi:hypothetical protein
MTSAFENTMHNAAPDPIVSAARFHRPNTLECTIFPDLGGIPGQTEPPKRPNAARIIRAAPKNRLRPAYTRAVHLTQAPYALQPKLTLSNS